MALAHRTGLSLCMRPAPSLALLLLGLALPGCGERGARTLANGGPAEEPASPREVDTGPAEKDPPRAAPTIGDVASWCAGCVQGGDTTDFGGFPDPCSPYPTEVTTVEDALARGYELEPMFSDIEREFVTPLRWQEQARDTDLSVRVELVGASIILPRVLPREDAGTNAYSCTRRIMTPLLRVTLSTSDGSISGWVESWGMPPPQGIRGKVTLALVRAVVDLGGDSPFAHLTGNLPLVVHPAHTPTFVELRFSWYEVEESPTNRVGIEIVSMWREASDGPNCPVGYLCYDYHAVGLPPDSCYPAQLPLNGVCTNLVNHPDYAVIRDAGVIGDAGAP